MRNSPTSRSAVRRHPADYRGEIEHAEVARILSVLEHSACAAYRDRLFAKYGL